MVTGLLTSGWIAFDEWTPGVTGRATYAQNTVRRFRRWLSNPRIDALRLYAALLRRALEDCPDARWVAALDTTVFVEHVLRGSGGAGLAGTRGAGGVESVATSQRQRGFPRLPGSAGICGAAIKRASNANSELSGSVDCQPKGLS